MTPTIRIDDEVYGMLKERAEPFVDAPNDVLRRMLGLTNGSAPAIAGATLDRQGKIKEIIERIVAEDTDQELLEGSNKAWIYFNPRSWASPNLLKGSTKGGRIVSFLVVNRPVKKTLQLNLEIQPGPQGLRRRIFEAARNEPWFTGIKMAPMYTRISRKTFLDRQDFDAHGHDMRWIENRIREKMAEFKSEEFKQIDAFVRGITF